MTAVDSWQLVTRAQSGDADAFARIYQDHRESVYRFVYHRVGSVPVAEDLAQDVWVRALRSIGTVTWQGKDIGAWLITIARNLVADHFKSARVRLSSSRNLDDLITERTEPVADDDPVADVLNGMDAAEARRLLAPLLPLLTRDQLRVVRLRFFDELSTAEAAAVMGKQVGAVKAAQSRACAAIREALAVAS